MRVLRCFFALFTVLMLAGSALAGDVTFNYQGRVKVNGKPFSGTGYFKFAVMNTSASLALWSNDGTLSGEPQTSVPLTVSEGIFSVTVGDTALGMAPMNSSIFASKTPLRLRVWVDADGLGFEQLHPDQVLVDLVLNATDTGTQGYFLYVDGTNGNDANNGLTTETAKKTIQAAVDAIPPQVRCDLTVKIFPGVYRESVRLHGVSAPGVGFGDGWDGGAVRFIGDETWTPTSGRDPNVRITGCDNDATHERVRRFCLVTQHCSSVVFQGILFDYAGHIGACVESGEVHFIGCKFAYCTSTGVCGFNNTNLRCVNCIADNNGYGITVNMGALYVTNCYCRYNTYAGTGIKGPAYEQVGGGEFDHNQWGIWARDFGQIAFGDAPKARYNTGAGVSLSAHSFSLYTSQVVMSGNATNVSTDTGAISY